MAVIRMCKVGGTMVQFVRCEQANELLKMWLEQAERMTHPSCLGDRRSVTRLEEHIETTAIAYYRHTTLKGGCPICRTLAEPKIERAK